MEETHLYCPWDGKRYISNSCSHCGRSRFIKKPQWKKVLYEKQPFDDTYVSESFLNSLIPKENSQKYEYSTLVESTVEIAYAFNSLILFLLVHEVAHKELVSDKVLMILMFSVLIAGYCLYILLINPDLRSLKPIRVGFLLLGMLYTLCPVLSTINKNYADDTIFLMTFIFCVLHLVFYDYSFVKNALVKDKRKIPDAKSLNFSLIAVVLLSSRLNSMDFVYCLHCVGFM
jgi:phosphatidylinositol glycan class C protein